MTTSGMKRPPTPPPATVADGREATQEQDDEEQPDRAMRLERPGDGVVADADRHRLVRERVADPDDKRPATRPRPTTRTTRPTARRHLFGAAEQRGEHARDQPAGEAEHDAADQVRGRERGRAVRRASAARFRGPRRTRGSRSPRRPARGAASCGRSRPGTGTSSANTAPVAGALKIAATPAAAPGDHQHPVVDRAEEPPEPGLDPGADRRAEVERRSLETHRAAEAERPDRGEHPGRERCAASGRCPGSWNACRYASVVADEGAGPSAATPRRRSARPWA